MTLTRRQWLTWAIAGGAAAARVRVPALHAFTQGDDDAATVARRVIHLIGEYEAQGYHRTATAVDRASGDWLAGQVRQAGLTPALEPFELSRVDPVTVTVTSGDRRLDGIPLFDAPFTEASGVSGRLGLAGSDAPIALCDTAVNAAGAGPLGDARRSGRYQAIVVVTRGRRPGLCPSNADSFRQPFGPPAVQVSSEEGEWLAARARAGDAVTVIAHVRRTPATAVNVVATLSGSDPTLAPFVVMTPRSGWYWCASERGGGIACWLEVMRRLRAASTKAPLPRTVHFVASSGHELGHLGIDAFIAARPGIAANALGWLHLGANIGAAVDAGNTLQASDDGLDAALTSAMNAVALAVHQRNPRGRVPGGEAEAVHRGGGRYVSVIGGNGLFHHLGDRGATAIDASAIARFSTAFTEVVGGAARRAQV